jgi:hypothetical protein
MALYALSMISWVMQSGPGVLPLILAEQALWSSAWVRLGQSYSAGL